ncbi:hypothetical protein AX16_000860 [Volvariella volvacea WC 439]|nr:hypothetical protein AX16_000860 [Volvariella volvacea WC 439]
MPNTLTTSFTSSPASSGIHPILTPRPIISTAKALKEVIQFNKRRFQFQLRDESYTYYRLARMIYEGRQRTNANNGGIAQFWNVSFLKGSTESGGILEAVLSGRSVAIENEKLKLLEKEWLRRGQPHLPDCFSPTTPIHVTLLSSCSPDELMFVIDFAIFVDDGVVPRTVHSGIKVNGYEVGTYYEVTRRRRNGRCAKIWHLICKAGRKLRALVPADTSCRVLTPDTQKNTSTSTFTNSDGSSSYSTSSSESLSHDTMLGLYLDDDSTTDDGESWLDWEP